MQMFTKILTLCALTAFFAGTAAASTYRLVLQSGHEDLPVAVRWHDDSNTVVSIGEDGRLIVTDPEKQSVLHRFRVSNSQVHDLALNPVSDKAAVVTRENDGFAVSVWDWSDQELEYDYKLDSEPLFVSWSARGRYLIVGNLGSPSVIVLEGRTGRRLSYMQRLPSLYNFGYIGSTETILMTYASSGAIRYWDIRSSTLKLSAETITSMEKLTVIQTGRKASLFGYKNETLYLVNRQTGAVQDSIEIPGLLDVSVDPETGEVDVLSNNLAVSQLHLFDASFEQFVPRFPYEPIPDEDGDITYAPDYEPISLDPVLKPIKILRRESITFLMDSEGALISDAGDYFSSIIDDKVWRPDSLVLAENSLYLSNGSEVTRFTSEFFSEDSRGDSSSLETLIREEMDLGTRSADSGLISLGNGDLVHWDTAGSGTGNGYRTFRFGDNDVQTVAVNGSLQNLEAIDDERLLSVDRSGRVALHDIASGDELGSYSALGILDAAFSVEGDYLLAGRSSSGRTGTPLEQIDIRTGEAIPVADSRFMIYNTIPSEDGIYTIGIDRTGGTSHSVIMQHEVSNPERSRKIYSVEGESLSAALLPNPDGRGIYTSLGRKVLKIDGTRKTEYQWNEKIVTLAAQGSVLYGIDVDGSLVIWRNSGGAELLHVYFFSDGGYIAINGNEDRIYASPGAIENVVIYKDGKEIDARRLSYSRLPSNPES